MAHTKESRHYGLQDRQYRGFSFSAGMMRLDLVLRDPVYVFIQPFFILMQISGYVFYSLDHNAVLSLFILLLKLFHFGCLAIQVGFCVSIFFFK